MVDNRQFLDYHRVNIHGRGPLRPLDTPTDLSLGGAAYLNVGTTAGTVAAGDDSRFDTIAAQVGDWVSAYLIVPDLIATPDGTPSVNQRTQWNQIIAWMNLSANHNISVAVPKGNNYISGGVLDDYMGTGGYFIGVGEFNESRFIVDTNNTFNWGSTANFSGFYNIGIDMIGGTSTVCACNVKGGPNSTNFVFTKCYNGTGIRNFVTFGSVDFVSYIRVDQCVGVVSDDAPNTPWIRCNFGTNGTIERNNVKCLSYNSYREVSRGGKGASGRNFVHCVTTAPALWDTLVVRNNETENFDYGFSYNGSGSTGLGPFFITDNVFDSMGHGVFNFDLGSNTTYLKEGTVTGNYMSAIQGNWLGISGPGSVRALQFIGNRGRRAGLGGLSVTVTGGMQDSTFVLNTLYNMNEPGLAGNPLGNDERDTIVGQDVTTKRVPGLSGMAFTMPAGPLNYRNNIVALNVVSSWTPGFNASRMGSAAGPAEIVTHTVDYGIAFTGDSAPGLIIALNQAWGEITGLTHGVLASGSFVGLNTLWNGTATGSTGPTAEATSGKLSIDSVYGVTTFAKTLLDDADASAARTTLGVDVTAGGTNTWTGPNTWTNALRLPVFTVATMPSASPRGQLIHVSNASGGECTAFSDSVNWRRCDTSVIVS